MKKFFVLCLVLVLFTIPAFAQTMTIKTVNDAGFKLDKGTTKVLKNFGANFNFTTYGRLYHYEYSPNYTYVSSYVYPPMTYANTVYNRVGVYNYGYARKGSGHTKFGTTVDNTGKYGTQVYKVTITGNGKYILDLRAYGRLYDNASASVKVSNKAGTLYTNTWKTANAYTSDYKQIPITVTGTMDLTIESFGTCSPSATGTGYYDGYYNSLYFYLLDVGGGSWAISGNDCGSKPVLGPAACTVTKGTYFDVKLKSTHVKAPAFALLGNSKEWFTFIKLPLDLSYMTKGCSLQVGYRYPYPRTTDATGAASWRVYLSKYASGTYYFQWVIIDPTNPMNISMTKLGTLKY